MTNAIIDNSTLTAVERVTGVIPVAKRYDLSGDLSAFESYLSTLLFYDQPVRIDDYKEEFSETRRKNFPELGNIDFDADSYNELISFAREQVEDVYLTIKGGKVEQNAIGNFLNDLDLHVCPAWHMQSSDFFLRIRLLSDQTGAVLEKYSPLMTAIFDQLGETKQSGKKPDWSKVLIGSDGKPVKEIKGDKNNASYSVGGDLHAFSAGLNWLALRSVFYALVAEKMEAVAVCHPIRSDFLARFYIENLNATGPDQRQAVLEYFRTTTLDALDHSNSLIGGQAFKLGGPLISAWATLKTGSPKEARNFVNDVRFSPEAIALRARLRNVESLILDEDVESARRSAATIFKDYQSASESLFRKFAAKGEDPFGVSANIFSMTGSFKLLPAFQKIASLMPARRKSITMLRNITLDLLQSPRLGSVSDLLRSDRKVEGDEWEGAYSPKVDHPKFRFARSHWKQPM